MKVRTVYMIPFYPMMANKCFAPGIASSRVGRERERDHWDELVMRANRREGWSGANAGDHLFGTRGTRNRAKRYTRAGSCWRAYDTVRVIR